MQIPDPLQRALEELDLHIPSLREAYRKLSEAYLRGDNSLALFNEPKSIKAYLLARMPATFAAAHSVLKSVKQRLGETSYKSLLDFGAGPGTASWAAAELFPELTSITLFEQNPHMLAIGKQLACHAEQEALKKGRWIQQNLRAPFEPPQADLALFSYVYSESSCLPLIVDLYKRGATVVVIEPGTPKGFANIISIRTELLAQGAYIIAPCPHRLACPHTSWCHFSARVERTKTHKLLKEGSLGYEDEKYSYIALAPAACPPLQARVVDHPLKRPGHVQLTLCTHQGTLEKRIISKKQKDLYRLAKDATWSSEF